MKTKYSKEQIKLLKALDDLMEDSKDWLNTPNDAFDGKTPIALIKENNLEPLWRMIYLVESGEPSA